MNRTLTAEGSAKTGERRIVHIINPVSGSGRKFKKTWETVTGLGDSVYLTKKEGDCADFVAEYLEKDPYAHIVAHGGDGTMGEAAGGIMMAGAGETALFTGVPAGSGNDFLHYMYTEKNSFGRQYPVDLIKANDRYSINVVNMGFDCDVVSEAIKIRKIPGMGGSLSYLAGVATTFVKKDSFKTTLSIEGSTSAALREERDETISDEFLLVALANGKYYGGGFKASPLSDVSDGYMDLIAVRNIPRPAFVAMIADYKKGLHINPNTGLVKDKFKKFLYYRRCKKISFGGIHQVCYDGEIIPASSFTAEIIPSAIMYTPPKRAWLI